jgi:exodeoxyribonuclease V
MDWSPQQDAALKAVARWLEHGGSKIFRLFGYAGTGKTTLARHFASGLDGTVLFAAYTGKAAHVLRLKGCPSATTIHSLIYLPKDKSRQRLQEIEQKIVEVRGLNEQDPSLKALTEESLEERRALARPAFALNPDSPLKGAKLLILDECSMVDGRIGEDLCSFGVPILALGDPAQLPPVMSSGGFFTDAPPDFLLTEIHRQEADNPIIALATTIRTRSQLPSLGSYGSSLITTRRDLDPAQVMAADQILVGRNKTRMKINRHYRARLGIQGELPVAGDRVICRRNNHDLGLLNGSTWTVVECSDVDPSSLRLVLDPEEEGLSRVQCEAHTSLFAEPEKELSPWLRREAQEFEYGYAMTVHKSQGSQFDDVMLWEESSCFRKDKWRWLYTGVTRAAQRITIVTGV